MSEQTIATITLAERIDADLKQAMRDRDETTKLTLRALKTAMMQARTSGSQAHDLTEADVLDIVRREAKRRRDTADEFQKVGSPERAAAELAEYAVLQRYLPQQLSEAEIEVIARAVIAELGVTSLKQIGQIMPAVLARTGPRADGKSVNQVVRRLLPQ
jgi:uncharacterized protein YqeY